MCGRVGIGTGGEGGVVVDGDGDMVMSLDIEPGLSASNEGECNAEVDDDGS